MQLGNDHTGIVAIPPEQSPSVLSLSNLEGAMQCDTDADHLIAAVRSSTHIQGNRKAPGSPLPGPPQHLKVTHLSGRTR